tara:strand:+ start:78 stop:266 length:189 start_codon:yes stop_codon:yes gene_type:complete
MKVTVLDKRLARLRYEKLISNCDKAIASSDDSWAYNYWKSVKEKLHTNMSKLGLLKGSKKVH